MSRKRPTIGELNERVDRGEPLDLHPDDEEGRAHIHGIVEDLRAGGDPVAADREVYITALDAYLLAGLLPPARRSPRPNEERQERLRTRRAAHA
jgi:hypothetical protein